MIIYLLRCLDQIQPMLSMTLEQMDVIERTLETIDSSLLEIAIDNFEIAFFLGGILLSKRTMKQKDYCIVQGFGIFHHYPILCLKICQS